MPKPKPVSQLLGNGRGAFRKALLGMIMHKHVDQGAFGRAIDCLGNECVYCGINGKYVTLQPDHLWPEAIGGKHVLGNIVPACPSCNSRRGSKDWEIFLQEDNAVNKARSPEDIQKSTEKIKSYMKENKQENCPSLDELLDKKEAEIRADFDLLLNALSQGVRAKLGDEQKKDVVFDSPTKLFDELIITARKFIKNEKI